MEVMYPTSYKAVTVPIKEVCEGPSRFNVLRKSGVTITPPSMGSELALLFGTVQASKQAVKRHVGKTIGAGNCSRGGFRE